MKNVITTLRQLAVVTAASGALLATAPAQAITVSVTPATQTIGVGDTTSINIVVSNLNQPADAVGGFQLVLGFSAALLSGESYTNDPGSKMGASPLDLSGGFGVGSLDLFFVADASEDQTSLAALQGASFTLANVGFKGLAAGLSPLTISELSLSVWDGSGTLQDVLAVNGEICVGANGCEAVVPEPGTLVLLSLGMLGIGLARRRRGA